jgi:hypothetical protein
MRERRGRQLTVSPAGQQNQMTHLSHQLGSHLIHQNADSVDEHHER